LQKVKESKTKKVNRLKSEHNTLVQENMQALQEIIELRSAKTEADQLLKQYYDQVATMQSKLKQIAREVTRHGLEKSTKTPAVLVDSVVLTPPQRQLMSPTMSQKPGQLKSKLCSPVSQAN
jgi:uncharacterized protein (DUF3084 family)